MASKYPDVGSYKASPDNRDIARRVECDFVASGSGSYYSRACSNLAAWVRVYRHKDGTVTTTSDLRCHRHRAIDERTATNRKWSSQFNADGSSNLMFPQFDPFDGMAAAKRLIREEQARLQEARLAAISAKVAEAAAYITAHIVGLDEETVGSLNAIHAMATLGTLVVR